MTDLSKPTPYSHVIVKATSAERGDQMFVVSREDLDSDLDACGYTKNAFGSSDLTQSTEYVGGNKMDLLKSLHKEGRITYALPSNVEDYDKLILVPQFAPVLEERTDRDVYQPIKDIQRLLGDFHDRFANNENLRKVDVRKVIQGDLSRVKERVNIFIQIADEMERATTERKRPEETTSRAGLER